MSELSVFLRHAKRSNARELDLCKRELEYIPKQVYTIQGLQVLDLSWNKISYIENQIECLRNLTSLNLSNNLLTQLPIKIFKSRSIQCLFLNGNPLSLRFQGLLVEQNQIMPKLKEELSLSLENSNSKITPSWLKEDKKVQNIPLQWDESIFKKENKLLRSNLNQKKVEYPTENIAKNGVLEIKIQDLEIGQQISMGGFSTIHKGQYAGLEVAVKKVFNPNINDQLIKQFNNELNLLSKYRHPRIVLILGAITSPPSLCIVMEYIKEGTLYEILHKRKVELTQKNKSNIIKQLISVLQYLHFHGIVHRDIKSHNVLLDSNYDIKLCDFGLAKHKSELNIGPNQFSGTPIYMSQELFIKKHYDQSVDIFALGTLFYEIYTSQIPYNGLDPNDIKQKILKDSSLPLKNKIKKGPLEMINKCRSIQPKQRPKITQLAKFNEW